MTDYKIVLFYKYTKIQYPEKLKEEQLVLCKKLGLRGRMIIASEGVNATFEGTSENIGKYIQEISKKFKNIHFKLSQGTGAAFPKLSIKVRPEIVTLGLGADDIDPNKLTGKYLQPEELHKWVKSKKEFYIIDMRNDYEFEVGHFEGSIFPDLHNFRNLPKALPKLNHLKNKTILTVCTGGVRCEKASGFLIKHGFADVYQLFGGIVSYMEKYPGEDFKGSLYTFDSRLVMGFNMDDPSREVIGKCAKCSLPCENMINCADHFCHRHFICCKRCLDGKDAILCPVECRDYSSDHPETLVRS